MAMAFPDKHGLDAFSVILYAIFDKHLMGNELLTSIFDCQLALATSGRDRKWKESPDSGKSNAFFSIIMSEFSHELCRVFEYQLSSVRPSDHEIIADAILQKIIGLAKYLGKIKFASGDLMALLVTDMTGLSLSPSLLRELESRIVIMTKFDITWEVDKIFSCCGIRVEQEGNRMSYLHRVDSDMNDWIYGYRARIFEWSKDAGMYVACRGDADAAQWTNCDLDEFVFMQRAKIGILKRTFSGIPTKKIAILREIDETAKLYIPLYQLVSHTEFQAFYTSFMQPRQKRGELSSFIEYFAERRRRAANPYARFREVIPVFRLFPLNSGLNLSYCNLSGVDLIRVRLNNCTCQHSTLAGAKLLLSNISDCIFDGTNLSEADMRGSRILSTSFNGPLTMLSYAHLECCTIDATCSFLENPSISDAYTDNATILTNTLPLYVALTLKRFESVVKAFHQRRLPAVHHATAGGDVYRNTPCRTASSIYVPRAELSNLLRNKFSSIATGCVLSVNGAPGSGKTQLIAHIAADLEDRFHVFWITCSVSDLALDATLNSLLRELSVGEYALSCALPGGTEDRPRIVVFDGLKAAQAKMVAHVVEHLRGAGCRVILLYDSVQGSGNISMPAQLSTAELTQFIAIHSPYDEISAVADRLHGNILAISLATAYINFNQSLAVEYLSELDGVLHDDDFWSAAGSFLADSSSGNREVLAAVGVTVRSIGAMHELGEILRLCAVLHGQRIPKSFLRTWFAQGDAKRQETPLTECFAILQALSLITVYIGSEIMLEMHESIQQGILLTLSTEERVRATSRAVKVVLLCLSQQRPSAGREGCFHHINSLLRHAKSLLAIQPDCFDATALLNIASLHYQEGMALLERGNYNFCTVHFDDGLALIESIPDSAEKRLIQARLYRARGAKHALCGEFVKGEECLSAALHILGEPEDELNAHLEKGLILLEQGKLRLQLDDTAHATETFFEAQRCLAASHTAETSSSNIEMAKLCADVCLAETKLLEGRASSASLHLDAAVSTSPISIDAISSHLELFLAALLCAQSYTSSAVYDVCLANYIALNGRYCVEIARVLLCKGLASWSIGDLLLARQQLETVCDMGKGLFGDIHPLVIKANLHRARVENRLGHHSEALMIVNQQSENLKAVFGGGVVERHSSFVMARIVRGEVHLFLGQHEEAVAQLRSAHEMTTALFDNEHHPLRLDICCALGETYLSMGEVDQALQSVSEAHAYFSENGVRSLTSMRTAVLMAALKCTSGEYREAEQMLVKVKTPGQVCPYVMGTLCRQLVEVYVVLERHDESITVTQECLSAHQSVVGTSHLDAAVASLTAALAYMHAELFDPAYNFVESARSTVASVSDANLIKEHPLLAECALMRSRVLAAHRRYDAAKGLLKDLIDQANKKALSGKVARYKAYVALGDVYRANDSFDEALSVYERGVTVFKSVYETRNAAVLGDIQRRIAGIYCKQNKQQQAIALLNTLQTQPAVVGAEQQQPNSIKLAASLQLLGEANAQLRRHTTAQNAFQYAVDIFSSVYGETHSITLHCLVSLSDTVLSLKSYEECLPVLDRALQIASRIFPDQCHPVSERIHLNYGLLYKHQEKYASSLASFNTALTIRKRRNKGLMDAEDLRIQCSIASVLMVMGKLKEAHAVLQQGLTALKDRTDFDAVAAEYHQAMAAFHVHQCRQDEAKAALTLAAELFQRAQCKEALYACKLQLLPYLTSFKEGQAICEEVMQHSVSTYGERSTEVLSARFELSRLKERFRPKEEAVAAYNYDILALASDKLLLAQAYLRVGEIKLDLYGNAADALASVKHALAALNERYVSRSYEIFATALALASRICITAQYFADAVSYAAEALSIVDSVYGKQHLAYAEYALCLGRAELAAGQPLAALKQATTAQEVIKVAEGGKRPALYVDCFLLAAEAQILMKQGKEALHSCNVVRERLDRKAAKETMTEQQLLKKQLQMKALEALAYQSLQEYDRSLRLLEEVIAQMKDVYEGEALLKLRLAENHKLLANVYRDMGQLDEAFEQYELSLLYVLESRGNQTADRVPVWICMVEVFLDKADYAQACTLLLQCYGTLTDLKQQNTRMFATVCKLLSMGYEHQKNLADAFDKVEEAMAVLTALSISASDVEYARVLMQKGKLLLKLNRADESSPVFRQAVQVYEAAAALDGNNYAEEVAVCYFHLATVYYTRHDQYVEAAECALQAKMLLASNSLLLQQQKDMLRSLLTILSISLSSVGAFKDALIHAQELLQLLLTDARPDSDQICSLCMLLAKCYGEDCNFTSAAGTLNVATSHTKDTAILCDIEHRKTVYQRRGVWFSQGSSFALQCLQQYHAVFLAEFERWKQTLREQRAETIEPDQLKAFESRIQQAYAMSRSASVDDLLWLWTIFAEAPEMMEENEAFQDSLK